MCIPYRIGNARNERESGEELPVIDLTNSDNEQIRSEKSADDSIDFNQGNDEPFENDNNVSSHVYCR